MMEKKRIERNAAMAVTQVVLIGVSLFVLYRYLLDTIGVEKLGIWSVVLAASSASRISELGFSGSVIKFVAKYIAHADTEKASNVVQTAAISIFSFIGGAIIIAYPLLTWILGYILPAHGLPDALSILPYALLSLWIFAIAGIFQSGLDGCQRIDKRSVIMIMGSVLYLLLAMALVPEYGLMGLAYGQVIQACAVLLASWILLRRELSALPLIPRRWHRKLFGEMLSYGVNFQIISVVRMLFDPTTKALLSKFGDLPTVGYYEMASRMIMQLRLLLVSANQVVVPFLAGLQETDPGRIRNVYKETYSLMIFLSLPFNAVIIAFLPLVSEIWIGRYEQIFVVFGMILSLGWLINSLTAPAYFAYLGSGLLRWNTLGQVTTGGLNVIFGYLLGFWIGGMGVVIGWALALSVGSLISITAYHVENKLGFGLLTKDALLILGCGTATMLALLTFYELHGKISVPSLFALVALIFGFTVGPLLWRHPMRGRFLSRFSYNQE